MGEIDKQKLVEEVSILRSMLRESEANTGRRVAAVSVYVKNDGSPMLRFIITAPTVLSEESFGRYVGAQVAAGLEVLGFRIDMENVDTSMCTEENL